MFPYDEYDPEQDICPWHGEALDANGCCVACLTPEYADVESGDGY